MPVQQPGKSFIYGSTPAGGFTLDYAAGGPADAAVTLVSLPGSAGLEMSTAKDVLSRKYRVIEINPPGWGGRADLSRVMHMEEIAALQAEAASRLAGGPYYVIGTSMGGVAAIHLAAENPDRVQGVVLEGAMAPALVTDLWAPPPPQRDGEPGAEPEAAGPAEYPLPPLNPNKPWATEDFIRTQMANRFAMFRWVRFDMLPETALAKVNASGVRVLALLGDQDEILRPSQRETFAKYLPSADFRSVPGGGHDLQNTSPDEFVALVEQFAGSA
jgi:pimeloyl-ACP methyl ester carboxylesterase